MKGLTCRVSPRGQDSHDPSPASSNDRDEHEDSEMSSADSSCYTVVFESSAEYPSASELRQSLEKGSDEVKIDTLRKIIISTINGNPQASTYRVQSGLYVLTR